MTNKPMLSVEREVIEKALRDALTIRFDTDSHVTKLRSLLDQPAYPNRLCHADYTAHPYICGCLKGDEEAQRKFDEHQAKAAQRQCEPVACMPVDRCYDVRSKMIIAFNEAKKAGGDLDDALDAAYKSALRYSPNPMTSERPAPVAVVMPFAEKVIRKLQRYEECASDNQGADIGRHWFDLLTQLGLLNRAQRSPALWEMTQQGEDVLETARLNGVNP